MFEILKFILMILGAITITKLIYKAGEKKAQSDIENGYWTPIHRHSNTK